MNRALATAVVATFWSCGPSAVERAEAASDDDATQVDGRIQGGQTDPGHPAVGLLWFVGGGFCTGTLIAPDVVLTAGHCVQNQIDGFYTGVGTPTSNLGGIPPQGMTKHRVTRVAAHPTYRAGGCPNRTFDLGLVQLEAPMLGLSPMTVALATAGAPALNTICDAVGYGTHTVGTDEFYEEKRTGTEVVIGADPTFVTVKFVTAVADHGDSGGPLICGDVVVGATSCHNDGDWPSHQVEYYARLDTAAPWVNETLAAWASGDAGTPHECTHDVCTSGAPLNGSCDTCAAAVCAKDPSCCTSAWASACLSLANSQCGQKCAFDAGVPPQCTANGVVVSQVFGGGGGKGSKWAGDYVELHNRGATNVDVGGWALQYASASGSSWAVSTLPANTVLAPGGYALVFFAQGTGPTPAGAVMPSGVLRLAVGSGKVALTYNDTPLTGTCPTAAGNVGDFVGYGTANCSLGGPAPSGSTTEAIARRDDGCLVSTNGADFAKVDAQPHSASSPNVCTVPCP